MNEALHQLKEAEFTHLLQWTVANNPFLIETLAQNWKPEEASQNRDPQFYAKIVKDLKDTGWLMESQPDKKLFLSSHPFCKYQTMRLVNCISRVKDLMTEIFHNLESAKNLELKLVEDPHISPEKLKLISHLRQISNFQFEMIGHLSSTLAQIDNTMKIVNEEKTTAIETFLENFWGSAEKQTTEDSPPPQSQLHPAEFPVESNLPKLETSFGSREIEKDFYQEPKYASVRSTERKIDPTDISEDEISQRYQNLIAMHTQSKFPPTRDQLMPRFFDPSLSSRASQSVRVGLKSSGGKYPEAAYQRSSLPPTPYHREPLPASRPLIYDEMLRNPSGLVANRPKPRLPFPRPFGSEQTVTHPGLSATFPPGKYPYFHSLPNQEEWEK